MSIMIWNVLQPDSALPSAVPEYCSSSITVVTITPCMLFVQALQQLLTTWGFTLLGTYNNIDSAIAFRPCNTKQIVILMDSIFIEQNDKKNFEQLKGLRHDVRVLVIAKVLSNEMKHEILRSGGHGYLTTSQDTSYLKKAIEELARGGQWFERRVLFEALEARMKEQECSKRVTNNKDEPLQKLTSRERDVAELVRLGLRNKEIANKLQISEKTVKLHLNSIFNKLGISSRLQLCASLQLRGFAPNTATGPRTAITSSGGVSA